MGILGLTLWSFQAFAGKPPELPFYSKCHTFREETYRLPKDKQDAQDARSHIGLISVVLENENKAYRNLKALRSKITRLEERNQKLGAPTLPESGELLNHYALVSATDYVLDQANTLFKSLEAHCDKFDASLDDEEKRALNDVVWTLYSRLSKAFAPGSDLNIWIDELRAGERKNVSYTKTLRSQPLKHFVTQLTGIENPEQLLPSEETYAGRGLKFLGVGLGFVDPNERSPSRAGSSRP